ncbi:MAG: hypothetical protein ACRDFS_04715 [Chloroflexota bacterium]
MTNGPTAPVVTDQVETVPAGGAVPASAAVPTTVATTAPPILADRTRWGPIWAGFITTLSIFLVLEALFFAFGGLALKSIAGGGSAVNHPWIAGVLALIAFFVGGLVATATSSVRGNGIDMLNGFLVWALGTTLFVIGSLLGASVIFGTVGSLVSRFARNPGLLSSGSVAGKVPPASDLRTAATYAVITLVVTALAAILGGWVGGVGRPMGHVAREKPLQ